MASLGPLEVPRQASCRPRGYEYVQDPEDLKNIELGALLGLLGTWLGIEGVQIYPVEKGQ